MAYVTEIRDTQKGRKVRSGFCGGAAPRAKFPRGSESGHEAERTLYERMSETGLCERKSRRRHIRKHSAGICGVLQMVPCGGDGGVWFRGQMQVFQTQ